MSKIDRNSIFIFGDSMSDTDGASQTGYGNGRPEHSVWSKFFKSQIDPSSKDQNQHRYAKYRKYRPFNFYHGGPKQGGSELAISGRGSAYHVEAMKRHVKLIKPGVVIIAISQSNEDTINRERKQTLKESKRNIQGMIDLAHKAGSKVLLITMPAKKNINNEYNNYANRLSKMMINLAKQKNVSIVEDYFKPLRGSSGEVPVNYISNDGIHLTYNNIREKRLFNNIWIKLQPILDGVRAQSTGSINSNANNDFHMKNVPSEKNSMNQFNALIDAMATSNKPTVMGNFNKNLNSLDQDLSFKISKS
jgi:hypothetical protein